jgi:hypothetical protein
MARSGALMAKPRLGAGLIQALLNVSKTEVLLRATAVCSAGAPRKRNVADWPPR